METRLNDIVHAMPNFAFSLLYAFLSENMDEIMHCFGKLVGCWVVLCPQEKVIKERSSKLIKKEASLILIDSRYEGAAHISEIFLDWSEILYAC